MASSTSSTPPMGAMHASTSSLSSLASFELEAPRNRSLSFSSSAATSSPSEAPSPSIPQFTPSELKEINLKLKDKQPREILEWAIDNVQSLWQTTAFGLTGMAALDMVSKISLDRNETHLVPLIFLDTLYHFPETLELAQTASDTYLAELHTYYPLGCTTTAEFEALYGHRLWETDEDSYDYLVKVEPAQRAYKELGVRAVITGRRRSQGADRERMDVVEVDSMGLVKVNPLANWTFKDVKAYIDAENVPYNPLLDRGYRSIGDWHSTAPPTSSAASAAALDAAERSGRWAGKRKTECGLHKDYFEMRKSWEEKNFATKEQVQEALSNPNANSRQSRVGSGLTMSRKSSSDDSSLA